MSGFSKSKVKKDDDLVDVEEETHTHSMPNVMQKKDLVDEENEYDINPIKKKCSYCNVEVVTYVEHEGHPLFLIIAILVFIIFGYLAFIILPITYMLTKNAVHRCSRCLQRMGEKQCFGLPNNFHQEIWQIRLGKCSIVIARCYAIVFFLCFCVFAMYYVSIRPSVFNHMHAYEVPKDSKEISATWDEFLKDCGGEIIVENYVHAKTVFNQKYEQNIITWEGYYVETKQAQTIPFMASDHALNVLVKMEPTESSVYPDLVVSVSSQYLQKNQMMFKNLQKGDGIQFRAKIMNLGNEFKMHHLHGIEVTKTGMRKEISEIVVRESALP